uniref:Uncharacterized protein n=1 Tax=Ascaris lumbricoides TaxID=6252 RepID=A0A0M3IM85_ASCLU
MHRYEDIRVEKKSMDDLELRTPRRALGDKKNVFATPMKSAMKKSFIPENKRPLKALEVVSEKHPLEEGGDMIEIDECERQFRTVDPDAPAESFSFDPLPDTFEDLFNNSDELVDMSEVLHSLHHDRNFCYLLFNGLFTKEELDCMANGNFFFLFFDSLVEYQIVEFLLKYLS